jgi:hypothetical protein
MNKAQAHKLQLTCQAGQLALVSNCHGYVTTRIRKEFPIDTKLYVWPGCPQNQRQAAYAGHMHSQVDERE